MITTFCQLPIGARFEFRGRRYEKLALSMAGDEDRCGNIFREETEVLAVAPPPGVPDSQEFAWILPAPQRDPRHWSSYLSRAPGYQNRPPAAP